MGPDYGGFLVMKVLIMKDPLKNLLNGFFVPGHVPVQWSVTNGTKDNSS